MMKFPLELINLVFLPAKLINQGNKTLPPHHYLLPPEWKASKLTTRINVFKKIKAYLEVDVQEVLVDAKFQF